MLSMIGSIASSGGKMKLSLLKTLTVAAGSVYIGGNYLLVNGAGGQLYRIDNGAFTQITLPTGVVGGYLSTDGNYLLFTKDYYAYAYIRSGDTFSSLGTITNRNINSGIISYLHFNPINTHYAYMGYSNIDGKIYPSVSRKIGNTFSDEVNLITPPTYVMRYNDYGLTYSGDGNYLIVFGNNSPSVLVWRITGDIYTQLSITSLPESVSRYADISYDGTYIVAENGIGGNPYVVVFKRNGNVYNALTYLTEIPNYIQGIKFSIDGKYVVVRSADYPFTTYKLYLYERRGDAFVLTQTISEPSAATGTFWDNTLEFTPDGRYLVSVIYNKMVNIYQTY